LKSVVETRRARGEIGEQDVGNYTAHTAAGRQYAAAHAAHYATKDLYEALQLYKGVMAAYPNTREARYSQTQIYNIVKSVVPEQELLAAQLDVTLARLEHEEPSDLEPAPLTLPASELPS
jgi:hypothetical protein